VNGTKGSLNPSLLAWAARLGALRRSSKRPGRGGRGHQGSTPDSHTLGAL
jgi:hypothetical protein